MIRHYFYSKFLRLKNLQDSQVKVIFGTNYNVVVISVIKQKCFVKLLFIFQCFKTAVKLPTTKLN